MFSKLPFPAPQSQFAPRLNTAKDFDNCRLPYNPSGGFGRSTFPLKLDGDDDNDVEGGGGCGVLSEDERTEYRRRVLTPKTAGRRRKRGGGLQIVRLGTEDGANQTIKDGFHKLNNS